MKVRLGRVLISLGIGPDTGRLAVAEELNVNDVGVAAHRAVFNILLLAAAGRVERDHDLLPAGRAGVCAFVPPTAASFLSFLHGDDVFAEMIAAACGDQIVGLTESPLFSIRHASPLHPACTESAPA